MPSFDEACLSFVSLRKSHLFLCFIFVSLGRSCAFRMQNYKKEMNTAYFLLEKYQKQ